MNILILFGFFVLEVYSRQCGPLPNDIYITKGEKRDLNFWTTGELIGETIVETHLQAVTSEVATEPSSIDNTTEIVESDHPVTNPTELNEVTTKAEDLPQHSEKQSELTTIQATKPPVEETPLIEELKPTGPVHIHAVEESFVEIPVDENIQKKKLESANVQIVAAVVADETTEAGEPTSTAELTTTTLQTTSVVPEDSTTPSAVTDTGDMSHSSVGMTTATAAKEQDEKVVETTTSGESSSTSVSAEVASSTSTASVKVEDVTETGSDVSTAHVSFFEEVEPADENNAGNIVKIAASIQSSENKSDVIVSIQETDKPLSKVPVTTEVVDKGDNEPDSDIHETGVQINPLVGTKVSDSDFHKSQLEKVIDVITNANAQEYFNTHDSTESVVGPNQVDSHKTADLSETTVADGQLLHESKITHETPQEASTSAEAELTTISEMEEAVETTSLPHFKHEKTDTTNQDKVVAMIPQDRHPLFQSTVATDVRVHTEVSVVPIVRISTTSDPETTTSKDVVEKEAETVDKMDIVEDQPTTVSELEHVSTGLEQPLSTPVPLDEQVIGVPASGNMLVVDEELSEVIGNNGSEIFQNDYEVVPEMVTEPEEEHMVELAEMQPFPVVDVENIVEEIEEETVTEDYVNPLNFVKPSRFDENVETTESEDFPATDATIFEDDQGSGDRLFEQRDGLSHVPVAGDFNSDDVIFLPHQPQSRFVPTSLMIQQETLVKAIEERAEQTTEASVSTEAEEIPDLEASPADFRDQDQLSLQVKSEIVVPNSAAIEADRAEIVESNFKPEADKADVDDEPKGKEELDRADIVGLAEDNIKQADEEKSTDFQSPANQFPSAFTTDSLDRRLPIVVSEAPWERRPQDSPFPSVLQSLFSFLGGNKRQDTFREPIRPSVLKTQRKDVENEVSKRVQPEPDNPPSPVPTTNRPTLPTTDPRILAMDGPSAIIRPHSNLGLNQEELRRLKLGSSSRIKATATLDDSDKQKARFNRDEISGEGKREQFRRFLESQPMPLRNALLRGLPGERSGRSFFKEDPVECDWKIRTDPGLYILVTFRNISAPYSVDCHGAYIEVERDSNGYEARWCGERVMTKSGKPHVIFARRELRITVFDSGVDGSTLKRPTGFSAEVEVVDLFDAVQFMDFKRSGSYSSVRRSTG